AKSDSRRYRLRDWVLLALEQATDASVDSASVEEPSREHSSLGSKATERKQIGKYRVESLLGRGGMGTVYQCLSPEGRKCAVKIISERTEQETTTNREWFEHEIKVLSALHHPNIVEIIDHGTDNEQPFFVMEFVDGEPLSMVLKRVSKCDEFFA